MISNNREIKFRVWAHNRYTYDIFINTKDGKPYIYNFEETEIVPLFSHEQILLYGEPVVQQYTGYKDITGKDIYEGDILEGSDNYKWDPIVFDDGKFSANLHGARVYDLCELFGEALSVADAPRVIGNNCEIKK